MFGELIDVHQLVENIVLDIREEFTKKYDIINVYENYSGLCDEAYSKFKSKIESFNSEHGTNFEVLHFHGEQKHSPIISRFHWSYQHTWMGIKWDGKVLYVDPTSQQFKHLYKDIPDYYISTIPPKWYYWDRKNPMWNGITKYLNKRIKIKHSVRFQDGQVSVRDGIIEFFQYEIWGRISDLYRSIVK